MKGLLIFACFFWNGYAIAQQCPIVPFPNDVKTINGKLTLTVNTQIICDDDRINEQAIYLQQQILKTTGLTLSVGAKSTNSAITLKLENSIEGAEAYRLDVKPNGVNITAATAHGIFNGINSLLQLIRLGVVKNNNISITCWSIKDSPRFAWRGLLLDESRHYFGMEMVKELLDWMAFYKLNKFHWHLTDEPAWRLEIKAYPKLALTGGIGNFDDPKAPSQYYTQEQIKDVVAYAADRFIDVIPEIDMPGHASAANKAYPVFSGGGSTKHPEFTFNPGLDSTYSYLGRILRETDVLFPSQMVHLGGDEVSFGNEKWRTDPGVIKLMQDQHLADLTAVEHYFTARMADTLFQLNNKVLLWDEAADADLPRDKTLIFWWRHDHPEQLKKALDKGYFTILCPRLPFYFDFMQDSTQRLGRKWKGAIVTLDKLYAFNLNDLQVSNEHRHQIIGVQAGIWTEFITTKEKLEYMLFPRITALAEIGWTLDEKKSITGFHQRVLDQLKLYCKDGIYYYNPFKPQQTPEPLTARQVANLSE